MDPAIPAQLKFVAPLAVGDKTLVAGRHQPETLNARGAAASVRGLGADPAALSRLAAIDRMATGRGGQDAPSAATASIPAQASLLPGEVVVLDMPNARRAPADKSSGSIRVTGGSARVLAFGLGGAALQVEPGSKGRFVLPPRVSRIVIMATAGSRDADPGLDGWLAERELPFIGWSTALCAGGTVCVEGSALGQGEERARAGWIRAGRLVSRGAVVTRFEQFNPVVALIIEGAVQPQELDEFALSLEGARDKGATPLVVSLGNRSVLIFELSAEKSRAPGPFSLRFASAANERLAGVLAAPGQAEDLAKSLSEFGPEALIRKPQQGGGKPVNIRWTAPRRSQN